MAYRIDDRNKNLLAIVDDTIVPRDEACLPLWDAGFLHGKQIWTSPRLVHGKIFRLKHHLEKMEHGIRSLHFQPPPRHVFLTAIRKVLIANHMQGATGVHIRILWTPGTQVTASMNNKACVQWDGVTPSQHRIIVMPEWRGMETVYNTSSQGEQAIISKLYRRPSPQYADQRIHSNNQIHSSLACDEATAAGVAACILLDVDGHVAETHASHIAMITTTNNNNHTTFTTPKVYCCPPGVTRQVLLDICHEHGIPANEADITPEQLLHADEVMILGTMSGPVAITHIDGHKIGTGEGAGPVTRKLQRWYQEAMLDDANLFDIFNPEATL